MAWYAYCIVEQQAFQSGVRSRRPFPIEELRGIGGAQILGYPSGDFAVIVAEYARDSVLDQRAILEHARVVSECFHSTTVLPFRFGTVFESDEALRRAVRSNRRAFMDSVANLRGKSEMHVKLTVRDDSLLQEIVAPPSPLATGREYLSNLRQHAVRDREAQTKARALSVQVHRLFNPLQEEICCRKVDSGGLLIDIAHLIDSKAVPKYQNRSSAVARQLKDCQVVISGPWPPYHFTPGKLRTIPN